MKKILFTLFAIIMIGVIGCGNNNDSEFIEESGTIEMTNIILSSQVNGKIDSILFEEGDMVAKGDTILIIDHELLDIQLRQAKGARDIAKAQYDLITKGARKEDISQAREAFNQANVNFTLAQKDKERYESLLKTKTITEKQYEAVVAQFDIAEAKVNAAKENLRKVNSYFRPEEKAQAVAGLQQSEANVDLIKKNIRDCYVKAPIKGQVIKQFVEKGETVSYLSSLIKISDLSEAEMYVYISEKDLGKVKLGQRAEISTDSYPDKKYSGRVIFISSEAEFTPKNIQTKDERTKLVFATKISIPNSDFELKAGMPADTKIFLNKNN